MERVHEVLERHDLAERHQAILVVDLRADARGAVDAVDNRGGVEVEQFLAAQFPACGPNNQYPVTQRSPQRIEKHRVFQHEEIHHRDRTFRPDHNRGAALLRRSRRLKVSPQHAPFLIGRGAPFLGLAQTGFCHPHDRLRPRLVDRRARDTLCAPAPVHADDQRRRQQWRDACTEFVLRIEQRRGRGRDQQREQGEAIRADQRRQLRNWLARRPDVAWQQPRQTAEHMAAQPFRDEETSCKHRDAAHVARPERHRQRTARAPE